MIRETDEDKAGMRTVFGDAVRAYASGAVRGLQGAFSGGQKKRMKVVESLALGGRRQLLLVTCDEQEYLIGVGTDSVQTIVLRQSPVVLTASSARTDAAQSDAVPTGVLQAGAAPGGIGLPVARTGTIVRNRPAGGPWLVPPEVREVAENRIRETEIGNGGQPWQ